MQSTAKITSRRGPCATRPQRHAAVRSAAQADSDVSAKTVTIEYQRAQAKALVAYFKDKQLAQAQEDAQVFGWTRANEIGNGRWVMMGFAIGLLTEYATGADFPQQLQLMLSYLGITDSD